MKKNAFRSSFAGIILGIGTLLSPCCIEAAAPAAMDECSKELLLSYFPEVFVNNTLKKFNVAEDKWANINKSLSIKDKEIVKIVEQKASTTNPNPLKDPQQRQAAVKLFRETLLQVFTDALKENGVQDSNQFQAMLDDIQQQKAKKFAQCMEKHKAQLEQQIKVEDSKVGSKDTSSPSADTDSDTDEDEDEDDTDDNDNESDDKANQDDKAKQEDKAKQNPN